MPTRPLTALLLADGKPGHYHQAEGVIAAIGKRRPVETVRVDVRRRFMVPNRSLMQLANAGAAPWVLLRLGYRMRSAGMPPADVVVSAGGNTLVANAAVARDQGIPNIFCGRLRRLQPEHVRLVIVAQPQLAFAPNHLVALPPSPIEPVARRARTGPRLGRAHAPGRVAVLIGGDSGTFRYAGEDWKQVVDFLRAAHRTYGTRWLVTTSRRSGNVIGDALAALAAEPDSGVEAFVDFRTAGPGGLAQVLDDADAILCTDDSTSMISEAIGTCLPVVSVVPAVAALETREADFRRSLAARNWYRPVPLAGLTPETFLAALEEITPRTTNPIEELAGALAERLPELFASP